MVFLVFLIPIGVIVYMYERKIFKQNHSILQGYINIEIIDKKELTNLKKIEKTQALLDKNGYKIVQKDNKFIVGEKKIFSIGLLFIGMFVFFNSIYNTIYYVFIFIYDNFF